MDEKKRPGRPNCARSREIWRQEILELLSKANRPLHNWEIYRQIPSQPDVANGNECLRLILRDLDLQGQVVVSLKGRGKLYSLPPKDPQ